MKVYASETVLFAARQYERGAEIDMPDERAQAAIDAGVVSKAKPKHHPAERPDGE